MCYIRGVAGDYDDWAAQGADGWDWASVLPCFMRAEGNTRGGSELHGGDGPPTVSDLRNVNPLSRVFIDAGQQAGLPRNDDFHGPSPLGVRSEEHPSELQSLLRISSAVFCFKQKT